MGKRHMFFHFLIFLSLATAVFLGVKSLQAIVGDGDITYSDTKNLAPVIFSHESHQKAKLQCTDCHTKIFEMKKGAAKKDNKDALAMKNLKEGKYCGACHNGKKAFTVDGDCTKCHKSK
jgi:c(7)-type cytochrome triheme protein